MCCAWTQLMNAALDISAIFDSKDKIGQDSGPSKSGLGLGVVTRHTRFTSREQPGVIMADIQAAATKLGCKTEQRRDYRHVMVLVYYSARVDEKYPITFVVLCAGQSSAPV